MTLALRRSRTFALAALLGLGVSLSPVVSEAAPPTRNVERFDVKVPSAGMNAGAARVRANASRTAIHGVVTDYARYSSIVTHFEQARVVGRSGDQTDVYLEVPILKGAGKIWAVVRFGPAETQGDQETIRGRLVKGNVKRLDAVWRIKKIDETGSELTLELLIVPDLPVPKSLLTSELRKAAGKAVNGARNEAEKRNRRLAQAQP